MNYKFEGIMPALITPLENDNKTVKEGVAREIIDLHLNQGANGFYILGGTGEGLVLSREQRERMCEITINQVAGRKPVICHVASINTEEMIALAKHAEKTGASAIAATPPLFFYYDETDIYNYYKNLAQSVNIPVIVYYHPSAQRSMSANLLSKICEIDNVTGVKWSSGDFYQLMQLKDKTHGEVNIINGPDELLINGLSSGADAGVGATYNVMLPEFIKLYNYFKEGNMEKALETQLKVNRVINCMIKHEVIPTIKYAFSLMGYDAGEASFPMRQYTEEQKIQCKNDLLESGWPFN